MARLYVSLSNQCWADLFEGPGFTGRHLRLIGPADFVNLRVASDEWGERVGSLIVGPRAYVQCFLEVNFRDTVLWLVPGQQVADVGELRTEEDLDSIRLFDRPPFASEPGFESYEAWHGVPRTQG